MEYVGILFLYLYIVLFWSILSLLSTHSVFINNFYCALVLVVDV